jgi:hypothetical protein
LLALGLIAVRATKDVVDLLLWLREVILLVLGCFIRFGFMCHFPGHVYKSRQLEAVSSLVPALRMENALTIKEDVEFSRLGVVLRLEVEWMIRGFDVYHHMFRLPLFVL